MNIEKYVQVIWVPPSSGLSLAIWNLIAMQPRYWTIAWAFNCTISEKADFIHPAWKGQRIIFLEYAQFPNSSSVTPLMPPLLQHLHEDFFPPRLHLPMHHPPPSPQPLCTSRFTSKNAFVPYFASKHLIFQEVQCGRTSQTSGNFSHIKR